MNYFNRKFANRRGVLRTLISDLKWRLGAYREYDQVEWPSVKRIVFICQGNICRSPFAEAVAGAHDWGFPIASFGLATTTGVYANPAAVEAARGLNVDLTQHRAVDQSDFDIQHGDLLLVMEDRHIAPLEDIVAGVDVQIGLLGLWCRPRFGLLYDPFGQSRDYFDTCFVRIENAVKNLAIAARESGS